MQSPRLIRHTLLTWKLYICTTKPCSTISVQKEPPRTTIHMVYNHPPALYSYIYIPTYLGR